MLLCSLNFPICRFVEDKGVIDEVCIFGSSLNKLKLVYLEEGVYMCECSHASLCLVPWSGRGDQFLKPRSVTGSVTSLESLP